MPTITLENATKYYKPEKHQRRERRLEVGVADVSLTIEQGEFVFVTGSSGAGKSTLLRLMSGQERPDQGKVFLDEKDLSWMKRLSRNRISKLFGMVWQDSNLMRKRTIGENLELAARIAAPKNATEKDLESRMKKVLGLVGLSGVEDKFPAELSIGQCRLVELSRALIGSPPILILDEVTANLDEDRMWDTFQLLHELNRRGTTVIMATHASRYVNILRKRVITLVDGRVFGDVRRGKYGDVAEQKRTVLTAF